MFQSGHSEDLCFFFTKNGVLLGGTSASIVTVFGSSFGGGANGLGGLFACVGISTFSACRLNFGETAFQFDLCRWENLLRAEIQPSAPPSLQSPPLLPLQPQQPTATIIAGREGNNDDDVTLRTISQVAQGMNEAGSPQAASVTLVWLPGTTTVRRRGRLEWLLNCVGVPMPAVGRNGGLPIGGGARGAERY